MVDDHKRAIYDEESLSDQEFFTLHLGPLKVNMMIAFPVAFIGFVGYFGYKYFGKKKGPCPIDHDHKQMFKRG